MDKSIGNIFIFIGKLVAYCKAKYALGYLAYVNCDIKEELVKGKTIKWY